MSEFFPYHSSQIGFDVAGLNDPPQRVIDQSLIAAVAGQRLEVFDDGYIDHDIDTLLFHRARTAACQSARLIVLPPSLKLTPSKSA